jgi:cytochrome P450 family 6
MVIIYLILLVFVLALIWVRHRFTYFERHGIPYDPPSFPMGNLKGLGGKMHLALMFQKFYTKFKGKSPVCGFFMILKLNVIVTDLDTVKDILIKNFDSFRNRGIYYNSVDDPLTAHLLAIEDNPWKAMRSKLTPTFTSGKMKMMFETVLNIADHMIDNLQKSSNLQLIEVKDMLANFTTEVIGNVAFGLELNSINDPNSKFRVMGKKLFDPENTFLPKFLFLASNRELGRKLHMKLLPTDLSEFFLGSIKQTIEYRIKNNIERNDFLNLVIKMYTGEDMESGSLTLNELAAQCFIFFIGGFETSSSTSTFVLYNLAMNQNIQEKLRDEIKGVVSKNGGKVSYEGLKEMKYLQMVIDGKKYFWGVGSFDP